MADVIKLKVFVIGDIAVGKTSLVHRYRFGKELLKSKSTIEVNIVEKKIQIENKDILVQIWDTAGQEKFNSLCSQYYHGASGGIVVYDLTRKETFESLDYWIKQCEKYYTHGVIPKIIIGNKLDREDRQVTFDEGKNFAEKLQIPFYETSKDEDTIEHIFFTLVRKILKARHYVPIKNTNIERITVGETSEKEEHDKKKFSCCTGNTTNLNLSLGKPF